MANKEILIALRIPNNLKTVIEYFNIDYSNKYLHNLINDSLSIIEDILDLHIAGCSAIDIGKFITNHITKNLNINNTDVYLFIPGIVEVLKDTITEVLLINTTLTTPVVLVDITSYNVIIKTKLLE